MAFQVMLFATFISLSVALLEVPGTPVDQSSFQSIIPFAVTATCDDVNVYSGCKDCSKVLVCMGPVSDEKDCATDSPDTPFCMNGACSASSNTAEGCFSPSMKCIDVGFYPDPKNCQIYHHCEEINEDSYVYECPPNYVYNAATTLCQQKIYAADCVTVKCDKTKVFSNYGTSKQFFAYCKFNEDFVETISMLKCAAYFSFDGLSCQFTCPKEGNFQHSDKTKYYQCYLSGGKFVYQVQSCTSDKIFDQELQICVAPPVTTTTTTEATEFE